MKKPTKTPPIKSLGKSSAKHTRSRRLSVSRRRELLDFDAARYLTSDTAVAEYLSAILEFDDANLLVKALGDVARARGMSKIAKTSGLGRESLYKALAAGRRPSFDTIMRVALAMGVRMSARVATF